MLKGKTRKSGVMPPHSKALRAGVKIKIGKKGDMEDLVTFGGAYRDKTIWLSGVTGFKGAWLAEWLLLLGARVRGFALDPPTNPSLFEQLGLGGRIPWDKADLRDAAAVRKSLTQCEPDYVFHLAAQPLVRLSYDQPVETYQTNVMGTIHVMEALRGLAKPCAAVLITTDKCYENRERPYAYREGDPLGGHDPYSSSKAACEIAIHSWRSSFFANHPVRMASARAGNVIGGGDWATDRILPDCVRALRAGRPIPVRRKDATRPWQHALEPLSGYLWLAACMAGDLRPPVTALCSAFNFGPGPDANRTVAELVGEVLQHWPGRWEDKGDPEAVHEAGLLQLSTEKAKALLGWSPVWSFEEAVGETVGWYRGGDSAQPAETIRNLTVKQIGSYTRCARARGAQWAAKKC